MLKRVLAGVIVAVVQVSGGLNALAEEVPINGGYGTLASCILWVNDSVRHMAGYDGN